MKWMILAAIWGLLCLAISWVAAMVKAKEPSQFMIWMAIGWGFSFLPVVMLTGGLMVSWQIQQILIYL